MSNKVNYIREKISVGKKHLSDGYNHIPEKDKQGRELIRRVIKTAEEADKYFENIQKDQR